MPSFSTKVSIGGLYDNIFMQQSHSNISLGSIIFTTFADFIRIKFK